MTTKATITESGMKFGPYQSDCFFQIEKSDAYAAVREGVKIADFLLLQQSTLLVVEAKSSVSNPETQGGEDFDKNIADICEQLINAFSLGWASRLGRHPKSAKELPKAFKNLDLRTVQVRFVLVIKAHKEEWLSRVNEVMKKALRPTVKTWGLGPNSVLVLNDKGARKHKLIA
ncbi:MAG: hypothetical protein OXF42_01970 [Candidatus Dadabacteria bacterium]|nr:hypothetical protein [Candidatus Dadabacteria bacterium]